MPSLAQTLPTTDIGFLRIVAALWGLELTSSDPAEAAVELAESLCDAELLEEVVSTLPKEGRSALDVLAAENGRMPWVIFARRFGELREMGPGKRDREQPHMQPSSATEILWYRALLAKAFFNGEKGPQEFAFIPDDLFMALDFAGMIPETAQDDLRSSPGSFGSPSSIDLSASDIDLENLETTKNQKENSWLREQAVPLSRKARRFISGDGDVLGDGDALGRPASPAEKASLILANDWILDDACSFLAALRMGIEPPEMRIPIQTVLRELLIASGLINLSALNSDAVKTFLEAPREKALAILQEGWRTSENFNELRQLPGLVFEGAWSNQPLVTREFLLNLLESVPDGQWWSLSAFVRDVKTRYPDYQRPAGDYDSWFIMRKADGAFLRGFSNWDEVDGALIRYLISGPLHWLGLLDLASFEAGAPPAAFRAHTETRQSDAAISTSVETQKLTVTSQGKIIVPRLAPRAVRYQIARFCEVVPVPARGEVVPVRFAEQIARGEWEDQKDQEYHYHVTAGSLKQARTQGLKVEHLLGILRKHTSAALPPPFVKALQRWELNGSEARVENLVVLKVSRPEVLNELRASKASRFLGEILGPTTVVIQAGAQSKVMAALAEIGILAE